MYFDPQVKERGEDFFNFEVLQKELAGAIANKLVPLIAVSGLRRTGKTSLIRVVLGSLQKKYVWLDGRNIISQEDFYAKLFAAAQKLRIFRIGKLSIKGVDIDLSLAKDGLDYLNKRKIVLVVDEAQLLKKMKLDNAIAYIYDNFPGIKIILSGSEAGMLASFLGQENASAPLYGRAVYEIKTHRLARDGSYRFLQEGAKQVKLKFSDDEIIEAINKLDGIVGWLTKYGWCRLSFSHSKALSKTLKEGAQIVRAEFARFASRAEDRYWAILRALKEGAAWADIKRKTALSKSQLNKMLKRMIAYGFVEKRDQVYSIADPLLEAAL